MQNRNFTLGQRPVQLQLWNRRFPITAVVSILHRISGVFLWGISPVLLYLFQWSRSSQANFDAIKTLSHMAFFRLFYFAVLGSFFYHSLAGVRHLWLDTGYGIHGLGMARFSAYLILMMTGIFCLFMGYCLW